MYTMQEMTVYSANKSTMQPRDITEDLFNDFISWIDCGEITTKTYIRNFRHFLYWMQDNNITRPVRQDILNYREYLIQKGLKPSTIAVYLRSVKQFFGWTDSNGYYPNVAANIRPPKVDHGHHKKDCLTAADVRTIENSITECAAAKTEAASHAVKDTEGRIERSTEQGKRLYAMFLLAVNAGLRTIEIHRANIKDLQIKGDEAWLYIWGKGHSEPDQKKAIAPEVVAAIQDYLQSRTDQPTGTSPLFVSTGNRSKGQRIATTTISTMLKRAMQNAGFDSERLTAHSLRHTTGTAVQSITNNLYDTQHYMRHANPATTEIYLHNETEKKDTIIAKKLFAFYHDEPTDKMEPLESSLQKLTPEQIKQLTVIANEMAG